MQTPSRVPRILTAIVVAFIVGGLGAAALGWIGWRGAPPLPTTDYATSVSTQVADGPVDGVLRNDRLFGDPYQSSTLSDYLVGGDDYGSGYVDTTTTSPITLDAARTAMAGLGWRLGPYPFGGPGFSARQDDTVVTVVPNGTRVIDGSSAAGLAFEFERAEPASVRPLTIAGWLAGFALGLLGTLWLVTIAGRRGSGSPYKIMGWLGIALMLPGTVTTTGDLIHGWTLPDTVQPPAPWSDYIFYGIRLVTIIGLLLLVVSALAALRPARPTAATARLVEQA